MKLKSKTVLGLVASCTVLCSMPGAYGELLYQWNFNDSDGANTGPGMGGSLEANAGLPTGLVQTGTFAQTGVSGNAWDKALYTYNGQDNYWLSDVGNAAGTSNLDLSTVNQFTITMWVKRGGGNNNDLLNLGSTTTPGSTSNPGISVGLGGNWHNGVRLGVNGKDGWSDDLWGAGYTTEWVFLAVAYDGTDTVNVWDNATMNGLYTSQTNAAIITGGLNTPAALAQGVPVHTGDWSTPVGPVSLSATATAILANNGASSTGFTGNLDDVRIYNNLLTLAEIEAIRQSAFAEPLPPVNLYWKGGVNNNSWASTNWYAQIEGSGAGVNLPVEPVGVAFATTDADPSNLVTELGANQTVGSIVVATGSAVSIAGSPSHSLTIGQEGIWQELGGGGLTINTEGGVILGADQTWKNKAATPLIVNSNITGTSTMLTKSGMGALELGGDNSALTGGILVEQGSLWVNHANALGSASASLTMNGSTLDLNVPAVSLGALSGSVGAIILAAVDCSLTLDFSAPSTYSCSLNNGGGQLSLIKKGAGNVTSSGAGTFTGSVSIEGGQFIANYANYGNAPTSSSLGNLQVPGRTITVTAPGELRLGNNNIFGNQNANPLLLPQIIVNDTTISSGNYNLIGDITLEAATLSQTAGSTGAYQGYQFRGLVKVINDVDVPITPGASTISGSGGNHLSHNTIFDVEEVVADADLIVSSPLIDRSGDFGAGPGGLTKTGAGTMKLEGVNSYTGSTKVLGGVLSITSPTLSDTGAVEIATNAVLHLNHSATDTVAALKIGSTRMPDGIYDAADLPQITGEGSLEVVSTYLPWISAFTTLSGPTAAKGADPDSDGLTNLEEFALDGNPEVAAPSGKLRTRLQTVGGNQALVITLPVRNGAAFTGTAPAVATVAADGIAYEIGGSNDLIAFDQTVTEVTPALTATPALPSLNAGWTYRTFRLDGAVGGGTPRGPQGFLRATVTEAP